MFCIFEKKNNENSKWPPFWRVKYLLKLGKASLHRYPVVKNFAKIPLVNFYFMKKMVSKSTHISLSIVLYVYLMSLYFQFCVLHFLSKIRKLNMTPSFGEEKIFLKLERVVCLDVFWGQRFRRNHSISNS